jgi:hypothetical protein
MKKLIALTLISCLLPLANSLSLDKILPEVKLSLAESSLTTNLGVILPLEILKLTSNNEVKIYLPDGTLFRGVVTKANLKEKYNFECFGEIHSHPNTGFGFVINNEGVFGAVVMRNTDTIYYVKYSEEASGYILLKKVTPTIII